jgi:hypothetical protein
VPTFHSAQDINALVRDFTKWDDQPVSLQHFAQSTVRAYKLAMTPPHEPVMIALHAGLQEETTHERAKLSIPRYVPTAPPQGEMNAVREAARLLVAAEHPVIIADKYARTADGIKWLVQLAEVLQAPVIDQKGRMNFPNTHHLLQNSRAQALIKDADVILGLELSDYWATVNGFVDNGDNDGVGLQESHIKPNARLISINSVQLNTKSNYQDFQRFQVVDVDMAGDAEATMPALIEAVKQALPSERKAAIEARGAGMKKAWSEARERTRQAASYAWDASPISTARMTMEVYAQIKDLDWSSVGADRQLSSWPTRLWPMDKHYHHIGGPGGFGVDNAGAVGAAGRSRAQDAIRQLQPMATSPRPACCGPRARIHSAVAVHNNRGYHQRMHSQRCRLPNRASLRGTRGHRFRLDLIWADDKRSWWDVVWSSDGVDDCAGRARAVPVGSSRAQLVDVALSLAPPLMDACASSSMQPQLRAGGYVCAKAASAPRARQDCSSSGCPAAMQHRGQGST